MNYFYTKDHLPQRLREMTNASGTLVARYDYDPYGRRTLVSGTDLADFGVYRILLSPSQWAEFYGHSGV